MSHRSTIEDIVMADDQCLNPPFDHRYGKEGWHSIDVEGNETIESIISRLQPRDGSDSLPQDMLPYLSVPFELSLNDRTPLARNVTLSDHEMVPGDMLYIIKRSDAMRSSRNEEFTREELEEMGAGFRSPTHTISMTHTPLVHVVRGHHYVELIMSPQFLSKVCP